MATVEQSRKALLGELADHMGENPTVVAMFVARMAKKLDVPDTLIIERLTALVVEIKAQRAGRVPPT